MNKLEWFSLCQSGEQTLLNREVRTTVERAGGRKGSQTGKASEEVTNFQGDMRILPLLAQCTLTQPLVSKTNFQNFSREPGKITVDTLTP